MRPSVLFAARSITYSMANVSHIVHVDMMSKGLDCIVVSVCLYLFALVGICNGHIQEDVNVLVTAEHVE